MPKRKRTDKPSGSFLFELCGGKDNPWWPGLNPDAPQDPEDFIKRLPVSERAAARRGIAKGRKMGLALLRMAMKDPVLGRLFKNNTRKVS